LRNELINSLARQHGKRSTAAAKTLAYLENGFFSAIAVDGLHDLNLLHSTEMRRRARG